MDPYQGTILSIASVAAILRVPGAIRDLRALLLGASDVIKQAAIARLDDIRSQLAAFGEIADWLDEAKELHSILPTFDTHFEGIRYEERHAR